MIILIIISVIVFCFVIYNSYNIPHVDDKHRIITTLYRAISRYSTASVNDTNPIIAYLHATYAIGYLYALEEIYTSSEIEKEMNIDHIRFRKELQKNQDIVNKKLISACPNIIKLTDDESFFIAKLAY
jgi:hypothetical protein